MSRRYIPGEGNYEKINDLLKTVTVVKHGDVQNKSVFAKYSRYLDMSINDGLRNGEISGKMYDIVTEMMKEIDNAPVYTDFILFRGDKRSFNIGDTIEDAGFISKTIDLSVAERFAGYGGTVLILHYPKKTRQLYVAEYSKFPDEKEMITYPGEIFTVVGKIKNYIHSYVYAIYSGNVKNEPILNTDLDSKYYEIEKLFPEIEQILKEDYLFIELYDEELFLDSEGGLIYYNRDLGFETSYEHFPESMVLQETPDQVFNLITRLYYKGTLKAIHKIVIPAYKIYDVKVEGKTSKEDSFYVAYSIVHGLLESVDPKTDLPSTEVVWVR